MKFGIMQRVASSKYLSHKIIMLLDTALSVLATFSACVLIRYLGQIMIPAYHIMIICAAAGILSFVSFYIFNTYKIIIRHSTIKELWGLQLAVFFKILCLYIPVSFITSMYSVNQVLGLAVADLLGSSLILITVRMAMVFVYEVFIMKVSSKGNNVLIYDIDSQSVSLADVLQTNKEYNILGFYKFGKEYKSYKIKGFPVFYFNNKKDFGTLCKKYGIKGIVFPDYETIQGEENRLVSFCSQEGVKMFISPPVDEFKGGNVPRKHIREILIEDLLGRDEIKGNQEERTNYFSGKTILVTGGAGSIGSELCRQLASIDITRLIIVDSAETPLHNIRLELEEKRPLLDFIPLVADVRLKKRMEMIIAKYRPQVVFHAAAYKHVPLMEENPCEAVYVNAVGTRNISDLCVKYDVEKMIMISTDKAVNPTNIMGASKRMAEIYVQSLGLAIEKGEVLGKTQFITTRFGNVLGSNGSVIPRFREQIQKGGPITVTHPDITRYFMTIPEACRLVMEAAVMSGGNEIFVFEMGEPVKIVDLARKMISLAGFKPDVDISIEFTGLRPGEKLYEEVLSNEENTIPTQNKKIKIAKVKQYRYNDVSEQLSSLEIYAKDVNIEDTVKALKRIIPEYKSMNSQFEIFDTWEESQGELPGASIGNDTLVEISAVKQVLPS